MQVVETVSDVRRIGAARFPEAGGSSPRWAFSTQAISRSSACAAGERPRLRLPLHQPDAVRAAGLAAYTRHSTAAWHSWRRGADLVWVPARRGGLSPALQTYISVEEVAAAAGRRGAAQPLPRGCHRRCQAVQCLPAGRAYFGQKVLPSGGGHPAYGRGPQLPAGDCRLPDGARAGRPGALVRATSTSRRTACDRAGVISGARRGARRLARGQAQRRALRGIMAGTLAAEPLAHVDYVSAAGPHAGRAGDRCRAGAAAACSARWLPASGRRGSSTTFSSLIRRVDGSHFLVREDTPARRSPR